MSGASLACCPVCGSRIDVLSLGYSCSKCKLAAEDWSVGYGIERIGFINIEGCWDDFYISTKTKDKQVLRSEIINETRRLWNDPEYEQWKHVVDVRPEDDPTLYLVFADWLAEKGLILNEAGVRLLVEQCRK